MEETNNRQGEKHHSAKCNCARVREIRQAYASGEAQHNLALRFELAQSTLSDLIRGVTWKHCNGPVNCQKHANAKLSCEQVVKVREARTKGRKIKDIAAEFNVSESYISGIVWDKLRKGCK